MAVPSILLLHSPLVGPSTWRPLADVLTGRGWQVAVPDLRGALAGPPYWSSYANLAAEAGGESRSDLVLVGHSGSGPLLPAVTTALGHSPAAYVFIDAGLPYDGETLITRAPEGFKDMLAGLTAPDGRLAPWTSWWGEDAVDSLIPDPALRAEVQSDCPRVPMELLQEPLPVPSNWPDAPCCYISFTDEYEYEAEALEAEARGWPVRRVPGNHLQATVDPVSVAETINDLLVAVGVLTGR